MWCGYYADSYWTIGQTTLYRHASDDLDLNGSEYDLGKSRFFTTELTEYCRSFRRSDFGLNTFSLLHQL